jgi:hypothetical protein
MPKITDDLDSFNTGDIVITQRIESAQVYHTTMFLKAAESPLNQVSFAHAGDTTEVRPTSAYKDVTPPPFRHFACPSVAVGRAVATQVVQWCTRSTPYGSYPSSQNAAIPGKTNANRYSGMVTTASLADIPFEISALARVLKWVEKAYKNEPLSLNRGITCCAFVAAAFQTAFMKKYLEKNYVAPETLYAANAQLRKELETKADVRQRAGLAPLVTTADKPNVPKGTQIGYVGQAMRDSSNRLPRAQSALHGQDIDAQWERIQTELLGIKDWTGFQAPLAKIIPAFAFYDVKYMNTKLLETSLAAHGWKSKHYDQY